MDWAASTTSSRSAAHITGLGWRALAQPATPRKWQPITDGVTRWKPPKRWRIGRSSPASTVIATTSSSLRRTRAWPALTTVTSKEWLTSTSTTTPRCSTKWTGWFRRSLRRREHAIGRQPGFGHQLRLHCHTRIDRREIRRGRVEQLLETVDHEVGRLKTVDAVPRAHHPLEIEPQSLRLLTAHAVTQLACR